MTIKILTGTLNLALALTLSTATFAAELLKPGLYRIQPVSELITPFDRDAAPFGKYVENFKHSIPEAAKATYAMVSRDPDSNLNKLVFLVDKSYVFDINSANKLCVAYAFPDSIYGLGSKPFCGIERNFSDFGATMKWTTDTFAVSWRTDIKISKTEHIEPQRKETPEEALSCALGIRCEMTARFHLINHYQVTHYNDSFKLANSRNYIDLLYAGKAVRMYERPDRGFDLGIDVEANSYFAILSVNPAWYQIERFSQDGKSIQGWINRDDLINVQWITQKSRTKDFQFRVAFRKTDDEYYRRPFDPVAIEVLDSKTGQRIQVIRDFDSDIETADDDALSTVDANFDGYQDLSMYGMSGGAGPNSTQNFFLFDPETRQFVFSQQLSDLPQITINSKNRTIESASRGGCCSHSSEKYRYVGKRLVLIANWDESLTSDGKWWKTSIGSLRNGKMQYRTWRKRAN